MKRVMFFVFIIQSLCLGSCEKKIPSACNVENPIENIQWLKEEVEQAGTTYYHLQVYSFYFENRELLLIDDEFGWYIKDCCGNLVCHQGDFEGDCSKEIIQATSDKTLIYECNTDIHDPDPKK